MLDHMTSLDPELSRESANCVSLMPPYSLYIFRTVFTDKCNLANLMVSNSLFFMPVG